MLVIVLLIMSVPAFAYTTLQRGTKDTGDSWNVYSLQTKLIELGYLKGYADGNYGQGTEAAVKKFQEEYGLDVTGIADETTQEKLFSINLDATPAPESEPAASDDSGAPSSTGLSTIDISIVQNYLYLWGFLSSKPDGQFGAGSTEALQRFQAYTFDEMIAYTEAVKAQYTPEPTPEPTPTPGPGEMGEIDDTVIIKEEPILANGAITEDWISYMERGFDPYIETVGFGYTTSGNDVWRVQRRLYGLKYLPGGVDGTFGKHTEVALKYFQRRNGLSETGVLDEATQRVFFSSNAIESDKYVTLYKAMVSVKDQRVYIYEWTGEDYTAKVHTFICSTGTVSNPTKCGTYQATGRAGEWYYMAESYCWVRYAFVIDGGYFFHSVLYMQKGGSPTSTSVRNLGTRASHGCVRLSVDDAKWIYDNCSNGMTVIIYDD